MAKRFIISEEERNDIRSRYGLVNEDEMMGGAKKYTDTLSNTIKKSPEYGLPKTNALQVWEVIGVPTVGGIVVKRGSSIRLNEKVTMKLGEAINFKGINGWGAGKLRCEDNQIKFFLTWD
jgi:hypothetical protein